MEIVIDTSAILAVIADEPESEIVIKNTQNAVLVSPNILPFEITNAITRMMRKGVIQSQEKMLELMKSFKKIPIKLKELNIEKTLEIAWEHKIYAYDAFYLETALRLKLPLLTFDNGMRRVGKELGINILGG